MKAKHVILPLLLLVFCANIHAQVQPPFSSSIYSASVHTQTTDEADASERFEKIEAEREKEIAGRFMKRKLYPQALKWFYKSELRYEGKYATSSDTQQSEFPCAFSANDTLYTGDLNDVTSAKSIPVCADSITACFSDGKTGTAYAVLVHVEQPEFGKRRKFRRINIVGHTFITLIKFNDDCSATVRSFGFYPKKDLPLSASPLRPASSAVFKDDARHNWHQVVGKFISEKNFERIIALVEDYDSRKYHLNTNNCTDFGLQAAEIAGISISNTFGTWPLGGKGNNPGDAGQSIIEGQIINAETGDTRGLFICVKPIE